MNKVKIVNDQPCALGTKIYINDEKISGIAKASFKVGIDELPTFTFETVSIPDIETLGNVKFKFVPETIQDSTKVLLHSLNADKELYNAFLASITSALKELPRESDLEDVAKAVADRIIGKD
ncbi:MAG: hypothetical protein ACLRZ9_05725 [Eubacterium sp.]